MGGLASVATDAEYRGRGIARRLCQFIREFCLRNSFVSMPLYTGKMRVYEGIGWSSYPVVSPPLRLAIPPAKTALPPTPASELTPDMKQRIIALYTQGPDFRGKALRGDGNGNQDWPAVFRIPGLAFIMQEDIYAAILDGALVELCFAPEVSSERLRSFLSETPLCVSRGFLDLYLPEYEILAPLLQSCAVTGSPLDVMHGERPMILDLTEPGFHSQPVFYPLLDKF